MPSDRANVRVAGQVAVVVVKGGRCLGWLVSRLGAVHVNLNVTRCTGRTRTNRYFKKLTRSGGAGGTVWVDLVVRLFGALCSRPPPDPQSVSASTLALHRPCSLLWPSFPGPSFFLPTFPLTPPPPSPPLPYSSTPLTSWLASGHTPDVGRRITHRSFSFSTRQKGALVAQTLPPHKASEARPQGEAAADRSGRHGGQGRPCRQQGKSPEAWPPAQGQSAMASEAPPRSERGRQ